MNNSREFEGRSKKTGSKRVVSVRRGSSKDKENFGLDTDFLQSILDECERNKSMVDQSSEIEPPPPGHPEKRLNSRLRIRYAKKPTA